MLFATIVFTAMLQELLVFFENGLCMEQAYFHRKAAQYLPDNVIRTTYVRSETECSTFCTREQECLSVNYKVSGMNRGLCQLNNSTIERHYSEKNEDFVYLDKIISVKNFVFKNLQAYQIQVTVYLLF